MCVEGGGGGGVPVHLLQKSSGDVLFFFQFNYFSPQLILSDYRSPMINFKEKILSFSKVSERYKHFQGIQLFQGKVQLQKPI